MKDASTTAGDDAAKPTGPEGIIKALHALCSSAVEKSLDAKFTALNAASYEFAGDLDSWVKALELRPEQQLYVAASSEYLVALLNCSQGQYRNAFKGLRLVLELVLQGAFLSVHLVSLYEWLNNQADTSWSRIVDGENGVFSKPYCRAFFPELEPSLDVFKPLSETLYREMSECTHGNIPNRIPLPPKIEFDEATFLLWHEKVTTLRYIVSFVLTMRYVKELSDAQSANMKDVIVDQLGQIESIRVFYGGPENA